MELNLEERFGAQRQKRKCEAVWLLACVLSLEHLGAQPNKESLALCAPSVDCVLGKDCARVGIYLTGNAGFICHCILLLIKLYIKLYL